MLNRKDSKVPNTAESHGRGHERPPATKGSKPRRRFIISSKAAHRADNRPEAPRNGQEHSKHPVKGKNGQPTAAVAPALAGTGASPVDLTETIKTLVHLAHENGHVTSLFPRG